MTKKIITKVISLLLTVNLVAFSILHPVSGNRLIQKVEASETCSLPSSTGISNQAQVGGVSLDQAANFLADMDDITGAYYDETLDRIVFIGKKNTSLPEFDKDDLAVAIRAIFFHKVIPAVSIDESTQSGVMDVNYYGGIENTDFGQTLFDADYALKFLSWGYDAEGDSLDISVSGYKPIIERFVDLGASPGGGLSRLWINPEEISLKSDDTSDSFIFDNVSMRVDFESLSGSNPANYIQAGEDFADHLSQYYDDFADEIPSWKKTKQLAKIVSVIKWISDSGIASDFQWAYDYEPVFVETPSQVEEESISKVYNNFEYTLTGGVIYDKANDYSSASGSATAIKNASEAVNAPKEAIHWTFSSGGTEYESVAVVADAFRSLGAFTQTVTDLSFPTVGKNSLQFTRTYSSFSNTQNGIGRGWSFLPATLVDNAPQPNGYIVANCGESDDQTRHAFAFTHSGIRETFTKDSIGGICRYHPDDTVYNSKAAAHRSSNSLIEYYVQLPDQTIFIFHENVNPIFPEYDLPTEPTTYSFKLDRIYDLNNNYIDYEYESTDSAKLVAISDNNGHEITINYDNFNGQELISSISDWEDREVIYDYDNQGNLLTVTDPEGGVTTYTYDENFKLASITDREENLILSNTYTPEAKVATQSASLTTTYSYDIENQEVTATDENNRVTKTKYDDIGRVTQITDPYLETVEFEYEDEYAPISVTDKNGNTTEYTYDSNGNVLTVTDANSKTITYEYDSGNRVTEISDGRYSTPKVSNFEYDESGNLEVFDEAGRETLFTYYSNGLVYGMWDPLDNLTFWSYDSFGNKATQTDPNGKTSYFYSDTLGRRFWETDEASKSAAYAYDDNNNLIAKWDAIGTVDEAVSLYGYDDENRLNISVLPNTAETTYSYNMYGSLASVNDANNQDTTYTRDSYQNLTEKEDALEHTTQYTYDLLNRRTSLTTELGKVTEWEYDANGNITKRIDANENETEYEYDELNRLKKIIYPDTTTVSYTYDDRGNLLTMVDPLGTTTYSYDIYDRLTSVTDPYSQTVAYTYDDADRLTQITYPGSKNVTYGYDDANRVTSVTDWNTDVTTYTYYDNGLVHTKTLPNGIVSTYEYDNRNLLTSLSHTKDSETLAAFKYTRDSIGKISVATESGSLLVSEATSSGSPNFVKGINFNGSAVTINGNSWVSMSTALSNGLSVPSGYETATTSLTPNPSVDSNTSSMLNSAIWKNSASLNIEQTLSNGDYHIYVWIMENWANYNRKFDINLEGSEVENEAGFILKNDWIRYGPYEVNVSDGTLDLDLINVTDSPHIMGMEIFEESTASAIPTNVSEGKTATGSSYDTTDSSLTYASAFDGDTTTSRWSSEHGNDPEWLAVDLGDIYDISQVKLYWETAYASAYQIQVSNNGSSWTPIYSTSSGNGGLDDLNVTGSGRYVRMYGTTRATQWGYSLYEMQVFGVEATLSEVPDTTYYSYDLVGRLLDADSIYSSDYSYTYDVVGNLLSRSVNSSASYFTYNDDNQVVSYDSTSYTYDDNGNRITSGSDSLVYDFDNKLATYSGTVDTQFFYDGNGNRIKEKVDGTDTIAYVNDVRGELTRVLIEKEGDSSTSFVKGINFNGSAKTINGNSWISMGAALSNGLSIPSGYETATTSLTPNPSVDSDTSDMLNSAIWKNSATLSLDQTVSNGNYQVYLWIMENWANNHRSFNVSLEGNQVASGIASLSKEDWVRYGPYSATVGDGTLDIDLQQVTDSPHIMGMEIYETTGSTTDSYYLYGAGLIGRGGASSADRTYYLDDGVGNIRFVSDDEGDILAEYQYDPYGNLVQGDSESQFLFKGEHLNSDTGLYYMRARFYDPVTGSFISKDPIEGYFEDPQTFNGYSYALNDPINLSDPSGEDTYGLCIGGSASAFISLGCSYCLVVDSKFNAGTTKSISGAGSTGLGIDVSGSFQHTNADTIHDLRGVDVFLGGSVTGPAVTAGYEQSWSRNAEGELITGENYSFGPGAKVTPPGLPAEVHGGFSYTWLNQW